MRLLPVLFALISLLAGHAFAQDGPFNPGVPNRGGKIDPSFVDGVPIGVTTPAPGSFTDARAATLNKAYSQGLIGQGALTNLPFFVNPAPTDGRFYSFGAQVSAGAVAAGDKVAIFTGAETGAGGSDVWSMNPIAHWRAGDPDANVQTVEVDALNLNSDVPFPFNPGTSKLHLGVSSSSGGSYHNGFAYFISASGSNTAWRYGLYASDGAISNSAINIGLPTLAGVFVGKQIVDGGDGLLLERRTDTSPTGYFMRFVNAAQNSNVALMDVTGNFTTTGIVTANRFGVTLQTPTSSSAACSAGQFEDDASYHYVCVATNTWKRVALSSF